MSHTSTTASVTCHTLQQHQVSRVKHLNSGFKNWQGRPDVGVGLAHARVFMLHQQHIALSSLSFRHIRRLASDHVHNDARKRKHVAFLVEQLPPAAADGLGRCEPCGSNDAPACCLHLRVCVCLCACVRACVRACMLACVLPHARVTHLMQSPKDVFLAASDEATRQRCLRALQAASIVCFTRQDIASVAALTCDLIGMQSLPAVNAVLAALGRAPAKGLSAKSLKNAGFGAAALKGAEFDLSFVIAGKPDIFEAACVGDLALVEDHVMVDAECVNKRQEER